MELETWAKNLKKPRKEKENYAQIELVNLLIVIAKSITSFMVNEFEIEIFYDKY